MGCGLSIFRKRELNVHLHFFDYNCCNCTLYNLTVFVTYFTESFLFRPTTATDISKISFKSQELVQGAKGKANNRTKD